MRQTSGCRRLIHILVVSSLSSTALGAPFELSHAIFNPNPTGFDYFGSGFVGVGDDLLLAGAAFAEATHSNSGVGYLIDIDTGDAVVTYENPFPGVEDLFGSPMVAVGDELVLVGARGNDGAVNNGGAVHVFDLETGDYLRTFYSPNPSPGGLFGLRLEVVGDKVIVGAPNDLVGGVHAGAAYLFDPYTGDHLLTFTDPQPEEGDAFAFEVESDGETVYIGARLDNLAGTNSGTVFVFDLDTGDLLDSIENPDPNSGDNFGTSLEIGETFVAVGATDDDTVASNAGAVYLFSRENGALIRSIYEPTGRPDRRFGALQKVGDNLLIGAPASSIHYFNSGNAYLYNPNTGDFIQSFSSESPSNDDRYGAALAEVGGRVLIADYDDSTYSFRSGAIYVYEQIDATACENVRLEFERKLSNPSPNPEDRFGARALLVGDDLLIGMFAEDISSEEEIGVVYVYDFETGDLKRTIDNPDPDPYDNFGMALAWDAETDKLFVGTTAWLPVSGAGPGVVEVFDYSSGDHLQTISSPNPIENGRFGQSLALVDGNLVVGAGHETVGGVEAGVAYLFDGDTGAYIRKFLNPTPDAGDGFGEFVSAAGNNVIVSARYDDFPYIDTGIAYLFDSQNSKLLHTFVNPSPDPDDKFGAEVVGSSDWVFLGAMDDDAAGEHAAGAVYMHEAGTGDLYHVFHSPNPEVWGRLLGVAVDGNRLLLGAWNDSVGAYHSGACYLYDLCNLNLLQTIISPDTSHGDHFGQEVALSGDKAVIGAWGEEQNGQEAVGGAYLYRVTEATGAPTAPTVQILPEDPKALDDLTCVGEGSVDPDGATVEYSYAWFRDGELLPGETSSVLSHEYTSKGQTLKCVVIPSDGEMEGPSGSDSVVILNSPPTAPVVQILPENPTPQDGLAVYIVTGSFDPDGDEFIYIFEWYESNDGVNWVRRPELSASLPFSVGQPEISSLYTQVAEHWRVEVTAVETDTIGLKASKLRDHSGPVFGEMGMDEVVIQANLSLAGTPGETEKIDAPDLLMLMSVYGETKDTIGPEMRDYFFDSEDASSERIGFPQLLGLAGHGWYREVGK